MEDLTRRAVLRTFGRYIEVGQLEGIVTSFDLGQTAETGSERPAAEYLQLLETVDGLKEPVGRLTEDQRPEVVAAAVEFILEGLHLNRRLNCDRTPLGYLYRR
jgi:magnesium chelatase subunit I